LASVSGYQNARNSLQQQKLFFERGRLLTRNSMEDGKTRWATVGLCGLPPIKQKALDGWGTRSFILCESATPVDD
jgi:hypothetical protein